MHCIGRNRKKDRQRARKRDMDRQIESSHLTHISRASDFHSAQCTKLITTRYVMYFSRKISKVGGRLPQWRDENHQDRDEKSRERDEKSVERDETSRQESLKEFADDYNPYWQKKRKSIQVFTIYFFP